MDMTLMSVILAVAMLLMLALGVWVSLALVAVGWLGMFLAENDQIGLLLATSRWGASTSQAAGARDGNDMPVSADGRTWA